jgi:H+/Cl- antiporter ClcA
MSSFLSAVINMPFVSAFVIIESSKQSFTMYPYLLIMTLTSSYLVKFLIKIKSIICEKYFK